MRKLRFTLDGEAFEGELYQNPVAEDLAALLPLTLALHRLQRG